MKLKINICRRYRISSTKKRYRRYSQFYALKRVPLDAIDRSLTRHAFHTAGKSYAKNKAIGRRSVINPLTGLNSSALEVLFIASVGHIVHFSTMNFTRPSR